MNDAWTARAEREYAAALADFSQPGNRWTAKGRLTYWGKAAGLSAEEIVGDARAAGVTDRDADIRRGWNDARPKTRPTGGGAWRRVTPRPRPKPPAAFPFFVRDMIRAGGGEAASADLLRLSPVPVPKGGAAQTAAFLSLWDPADFLFVFRESPPSVGRPGANLMTCADWLERVRRGEPPPGDLIKANPLTGGIGKTKGGGDSYVAESCIARRPFAVVEFDALPLERQAAFWRGLLTASPLAPHVAALVYSGGKSVHGLIRAGCASGEDWDAVRGSLLRVFAADPDPAFRADPQALRPGTGVRLAGVRRLDGRGRTQNLLYLDPEAAGPVAGPRWPTL